MRRKIATIRLIACCAVYSLVLVGCEAEFDSEVITLPVSEDGTYYVQGDRSYSAPFECQITRDSNSTSLGEKLVPLGGVEMVRNPGRTLDSGLLIEVDSARVVAREYDTWVWLDTLEEVEVEADSWNRARVRRARRSQIHHALGRNKNNGPKHQAPLEGEVARATVVEYWYEGSIKFRVPSGLTDGYTTLRDGRPTPGKRYPPFVFGASELPGEGVGFVIEGEAHDSDQFRVGMSRGNYCVRFKSVSRT